ncbi:hypothetical protein FSO04_42780 [Paraburkholderia madseniana]|uniref:Uncharacterized protein n=1 Tax=Paraburkholderia madseniana TaxID=2599607 RepID=A0A6N6VZF9_9BURK|nr:hypothetical protein [Paraburkholderia madseniana]KAE8753877.1 hypothetical protein FSO04_42780 [Paraburkholderia madseniana]
MSYRAIARYLASRGVTVSSQSIHKYVKRREQPSSALTSTDSQPVPANSPTPRSALEKDEIRAEARVNPDVLSPTAPPESGELAQPSGAASPGEVASAPTLAEPFNGRDVQVVTPSVPATTSATEECRPTQKDRERPQLPAGIFGNPEQLQTRWDPYKSRKSNSPQSHE